MKPVRVAVLGAVLVTLSWGALPAAWAAPFVPTSEDEIVERLPTRADPAQREQRARRAALAQDPRQLPLALSLARQAIDQARREGDPRELGSAQAALAHWWPDAKAPAPVRLLRATILQSRHEFKPAQADLDGVLASPALPPALRAQALLTRASLHQLHGRFDAASRDCEALRQPELAGLGAGLQRTAAACRLELQSLTGDAKAASRALDALALRGAGDAGDAGDPWLALLRAELAERRGSDAAAERHYRAAVQGGEVYARAAFADWLLDRRRAREALNLLDQGPQQADALLLRRAIALKQLGYAAARDATVELRQRFAAVRLRGDAPHLREEARIALDLDRDPARALELARQQWALQKEPADAVLLWRAALASGGDAPAQVARELRTWVPQPSRADVRLTSTGART